MDQIVLLENNARAERQLAQPIQVIIGNPPYSAVQCSVNDNNKNRAYPTLDGCIRNTYGTKSSAKLVQNLYDSYIRAIRWASDRIEDRGIVAFATNGSFLKSESFTVRNSGFTFGIQIQEQLLREFINRAKGLVRG